MKVWKLYLPAMIFFILGSCTYDSEEIPDIPCLDISYSRDVDPIIKADCAVPGCHVPGTGLPNYLEFSTVQALAPEIKSRTQSRSMPQGGRSLSIEEIDRIACWVDAGAPDN